VTAWFAGRALNEDVFQDDGCLVGAATEDVLDARLERR
jgi:hypothetical protein